VRSGALAEGLPRVWGAVFATSDSFRGHPLHCLTTHAAPIRRFQYRAGPLSGHDRRVGLGNFKSCDASPSLPAILEVSQADAPRLPGDIRLLRNIAMSFFELTRTALFTQCYEIARGRAIWLAGKNFAKSVRALCGCSQ
jgi:hypothetical protein